MEDKTFGEWMKERIGIRKSNALAKLAGMSPSYWGDFENDRRRRSGDQPSRPTIDTVRKIARVLDAPLQEALRYAGYDAEEIDALTAASNGAGSTESRELHDDMREEYDRWYHAFEGEEGFRKLSPAERDAMVRRAMEAAKQPAPNWYTERAKRDEKPGE